MTDPMQTTLSSWRRIDRVRRLFLRIAEVPLPEDEDFEPTPYPHAPAPTGE